MRASAVLLLIALLCCFANAQTLDAGNGEAAAAFNAALLDLYTDGTYDAIYLQYFGEAPERFTDCTESTVAQQYPTTPTPNGLLDHFLSTGVAKLGYVSSIAALPGFELTNGVLTGGFYPDLAEAILERISINYGVTVTGTFVDSTGGGLVDDHVVNGVFDVGFFSLFKSGVFTVDGALVDRNTIWDFSCGLATTAPIRYYVCPSATADGVDISSISTIDDPDTSVGFFANGAQDALARANFANSELIPFDDLPLLVDACVNGDLDILVELPLRIGTDLDGVVTVSGALGTFNNTGASFRKDAEEVCDDDSSSEETSSEDNSSEDNSSEDTSSEDTSSEDTSSSSSSSSSSERSPRSHSRDRS